MPGSYNMIIGIGIAALGIIITGGSYAISSGSFTVVAYGAIIVGAIQFVVGIVQRLWYQIQSPSKKADHHLKIDVRILLRSMIAVAAADGELAEGEIVIINLISSSIFGNSIDESTVLEIFEEMKGDDFSISDELQKIAKQVTPAGAELAIKASMMVALADGEIHKNEENEILIMANLLNVQGEHLNTVIDEARSAIDNLLEAQHSEKIHSASEG